MKFRADLDLLCKQAAYVVDNNHNLTRYRWQSYVHVLCLYEYTLNQQ